MCIPRRGARLVKQLRRKLSTTGSALPSCIKPDVMRLQCGSGFIDFVFG